MSELASYHQNGLPKKFGGQELSEMASEDKLLLSDPKTNLRLYMIHDS